MKLNEIAARIDAHLKRFERDKVINAPKAQLGNTSPYFYANAIRAGRFVRVIYVSYQGERMLTKDEAIAYLQWLDAGNVGTHYHQQHEQERAKCD